jgi:hypothetical protein
MTRRLRNPRDTQMKKAEERFKKVLPALRNARSVLFEALRARNIDPGSLFITDDVSHWESIESPSANNDSPGGVSLPGDPDWEEYYLVQCEYENARDDYQRLKSLPEPPKWNTPEELLDHCQKLRNELDPSHPDHETILAHSPTTLQDLWRAMRSMGGTALPVEPSISCDSKIELEAWIKLITNGDVSQVISPVVVNAALDSVCTWCQSRLAARPSVVTAPQAQVLEVPKADERKAETPPKENEEEVPAESQDNLLTYADIGKKCGRGDRWAADEERRKELGPPDVEGSGQAPHLWLEANRDVQEFLKKYGPPQSSATSRGVADGNDRPSHQTGKEA